ncbi:MAG: AfsR/SARP family transcriptional regulator, partial [Actinomycetota bacterium]
MVGSCRVFLLGGFRVELDGAVVPPGAWRHRRGADLVKILALAPGHRLHRERIIDALWPGLSPEAGAANLRKAIHFARGALGGGEAVEAGTDMVELWPVGGLEVDADLLESSADEQAVALYAGDLLPEDEYEAWAQDARQRLRGRFVEALKSTGRWERAVEVDPLDEASYRNLMRADLEAGDRQGAMRRFEKLREALHEEVGVGPDPETVALYEQVLAMEGTEPATLEERARAHLAAGLVALNRQELAEAEREATAARALAIEAGLGKELGEASGVLGMVAHMQGTWGDMFRRESVEVLERLPSLVEHVLDAHLCLAEFSLHGPGGGEQAQTLAGELLELAQKHGSVLGSALATMMLGEAELIAGRLDAAEEHLARAVGLYSQMGT